MNPLTAPSSCQRRAKMSEKFELVRAGSREDTYILLEGQNLKFECDLGMTSVPGRYRLKLTYKIERLPPTGEEVNPT